MMIKSYRKNILGTISFAAKFSGMRKEQEFSVYPLSDSGAIIKVQSETRIGQINLDTGEVEMSKPRANGSYISHFYLDRVAGKTKKDKLSEGEMVELRQKVKETGGLRIGESVVKCDNTGAMAL